MTFYVKSSASTKIEVGLGSYGDNPEYTATIAGVTADANWRKVIIPIPNPAKLTAEKGLFNFSAGTNDTGGQAYTLWIDEVKYEKLGTLAHTRIKDVNMAGFPTGNIEIDELTAYVNLPNGVNQEMTVSSKYFTFDSSNPEVATVEGNIISFHGMKNRAVLTPKEAEGRQGPAGREEPRRQAAAPDRLGPRDQGSCLRSVQDIGRTTGAIQKNRLRAGFSA